MSEVLTWRVVCRNTSVEVKGNHAVIREGNLAIINETERGDFPEIIVRAFAPGCWFEVERVG